MKTREFGSTGIPASEVGFGLWTISTGWWGEHSDEDAIRLLREAYDGIAAPLVDSGRRRSDIDH